MQNTDGLLQIKSAFDYLCESNVKCHWKALFCREL